MLAALLFSLPALAQDAEKGRKVFALCVPCHVGDKPADAGPGSTVAVRMGPTLTGVWGRKSGTLRGYRYSHAMKTSNLTWDEKTLDDYLSNPQKVVPGSVMPFAGVPKREDRADVIAFLKTLVSSEK